MWDIQSELQLLQRHFLGTKVEVRFHSVVVSIINEALGFDHVLELVLFVAPYGIVEIVISSNHTHGRICSIGFFCFLRIPHV